MYNNAVEDYQQSGAHSFDPRSLNHRQEYSEAEIADIAGSFRKILYSGSTLLRNCSNPKSSFESRDFLTIGPHINFTSPMCKMAKKFQASYRSLHVDSSSSNPSEFSCGIATHLFSHRKRWNMVVRGPVGPTMHPPGDFFSWVPTCLLVSTEWYSIMFP